MDDLTSVFSKDGSKDIHLSIDEIADLSQTKCFMCLTSPSTIADAYRALSAIGGGFVLFGAMSQGDWMCHGREKPRVPGMSNEFYAEKILTEAKGIVGDEIDVEVITQAMPHNRTIWLISVQTSEVGCDCSGLNLSVDADLVMTIQNRLQFGVFEMSPDSIQKFISAIHEFKGLPEYTDPCDVKELANMFATFAGVRFELAQNVNYVETAAEQASLQHMYVTSCNGFNFYLSKKTWSPHIRLDVFGRNMFSFDLSSPIVKTGEEIARMLEVKLREALKASNNN